MEGQAEEVSGRLLGPNEEAALEQLADLADPEVLAAMIMDATLRATIMNFAKRVDSAEKRRLEEKKEEKKDGPLVCALGLQSPMKP